MDKSEAPCDLDVVALMEALPEHGLLRGQVGTIVHIYNDGEAYEVEFSDDYGQAVAMVALRPNQLMVLHRYPNEKARSLSTWL